MPISESTATEDALINRVVDGRFRILELLGAGGMGAVYLAEHVGIGKRVAVKVLRADLRSHPDLVGRFRREAMAVSKLQDAHTITVFDFGIWKGLVYLVMEYLRGRDLAALLEAEGRLNPDRALRIAHMICSSLAEAHALGIVHRDLKPENIFITRTTSGDELVKVLDFGLAKIVAAERSEVGFQTADGTLLGTPFYMAPEQVRSERVSPRTDIYAVGGLLFRMITGRHSYVGRSPMQVLEGHLSGELDTFAEAAPGLQVPEEVEALVRRLLAREPEDRPATALEADEAMVRLLGRSRSSGERVALTPSLAPTPAPFPSTFSTSVMMDSGEVAAEMEPIAPDSNFDPPTRDEFNRYELRLKVRRAFNVLLLLVVIGAGAAGTWYQLHGKPYVPPPFEVEPNDEPAQATRILPGTPIKGHMGARKAKERSDRDIYVIRVPKKTPKARITVTGVPGIDLVVEGFDLEGKKVFKHSEAGVGEGEKMVVDVAVKKLNLVVREVWVQGERPSENSTDAYELRVDFGEQ